VWLLGSFAVLSLLYRTQAPAGDPAPGAEDQEPTGGEPSKRERARQAYAALVAAVQPVTGARLAEAADISPSYGRALLVEFHADPTLAAAQANGQRPGEEVGER
jgi:predicted secreted protein